MPARIDWSVVEAILADPNHPSVIDEEAGSLLDDGWHVLRTGSYVVESSWTDRAAADHGTDAKAKKAFSAAVKSHDSTEGA